MRTEDEIRDRLALELMGATAHPSPDSHGARAAEERVKILTWCLGQDSAGSSDPPERSNGSSEENE